MRKMYLLIILILICPVISWATDDVGLSGPALTASLGRDSATVGSMVVLTLKYSLPEGAGFTAHPEIKGLEELTEVDREIGPDQIKIILLVDRLGSWKTGPISLSYVGKEGSNRKLSTGPVSLTVLSNLGDKPEQARLRPIQGIFPVKSLWLKYLPWAAGVLGLLLIVSILLWWYNRRRGKKRSITAMDPPHVRAKKEIEGLEAEGLFEKGQVKVYYFRFSEILRQYLESLRGFPAAEFTTEEIVSCISKEQDRNLVPLLRQADLVKFADTVPTTARKEEAVNAALSYIRKTSPVTDKDQIPDGPKGALQ
ncbi:MAG: hypothetical protein JRJ86_11855 [Deltaproteobacteria bacterium]|nr:hypothetical protein [Deltaproteobacteria bacterium]MBW2118572.1 hypothetical protein [Deltaproteobacteria bacterium]MBW2344942.1 hypothetical protein [Deltaproteobacteria bacterium]